MRQPLEYKGLSPTFTEIVETGRVKPRPSPFSLRLSPNEKARLIAEAGVKPLGQYIRERLLGPSAEPRRKSRSVSADARALSQVLSVLGASRLSSNLNQIAKAANMGALPVSPDLEAELHQACVDVQAMRATLIEALGLQS